MENSKYRVEQFHEGFIAEWNNFVDISKNGTFLHKINYMHYHSDRFKDCSLILWENEKIVALLPGNVDSNHTFYSHQGLTYGGLLITSDTKLIDVLAYFEAINYYLYNEKGIKKVVYKPVPYIYSNFISQEDEYALFRLGAKRISCGASATIMLNNKINISSLRKRKIKKSQKFSLEILCDYNYQDFWCILENNLTSRYETKPVHTLEEIVLLKNLFPNEIKLFSVYKDGECVAGVVMYITNKVAHVQYIASNDTGKQTSALDNLFNYLIEEVFHEMDYFDFGTSVENDGYLLNEGLIFQKEGFGARTVVYNQYEYYLEEGLK